ISERVSRSPRYYRRVPAGAGSLSWNHLRSHRSFEPLEQLLLGGEPALLGVVSAGLDLAADAGYQFMPDAVRSRLFAPVWILTHRGQLHPSARQPPMAEPAP